MNKKFSTLLAGVALFGAMNANAGDPVTSLQKTGNGLYQLKATAGVLAMTPEGYLELVGAVTSEKLASTLWCVEVTEEGYGKAPIFDFTNKATGQRLDIAYAGTLLEGLAKETPTYNFKTPTNADSTIVGGEISGWAYLSQYKTISATEQSGKTLYSYFKADSVIGLKANGTNVQLVKLGADKAAADAATGAELTAFSLVEADMIRLQAPEINTILGLQTADKGVALTFTPDEAGDKVSVANPFNGKNGGKIFAAAIDGDADYVYVLKSDSSYLRVDTTVVNASGERFRAFAWSDLKYATLQKGQAKHQSAHDSIKASALKEQYKFAFSYYPSKDSLVIQVKEANVYDPETATNGSDWVTSKVTKLPTASAAGENNFVTVQDLIKGKVRIVTIYDKKETNISLGYKGCAPATSDKTSKDNGLYVIYNAKGQVLASPIHKNGGAYEWVTLDEQDPQHMPAYQWLVQKTQVAANMQPTSPLKITNREFNESATVQLRLDDDKLAVDAFSVNGSAIAAATGIKFEQITDSTILKDSNLGYRKLDKDSLTVAKYKFNYLHPYAQDKWIKKGEDKDSVLYAIDGYTAFTINEGTSAQYGATPANVDGLKGIAKLYRTQYLISLNADTVGFGAENKVVLGQVAKDSVYFKENNHYDGKHYYAIVVAKENEILDAQYKYGVADDGMTANLKKQPLNETRTSAFAISVDDKPLYRRFNNVALNESATDAADTLRFYESVRKEYLMDENNREGGLMDDNVNYLGIWTADKAKGLGFHVDTAWVNRGLGYIKPQYLISVSRTVVGKKDGYICEETTGHIKADGTPTDKAEECYHSRPATPGFVHAKFLVSFQDSVAKLGQDKPYTDIKNGYTRVGFVKAIQSDDKLFILVNGFENMKPEELDTATIAKAYTDAKIYNTYVKSLKNDNHKNYTWSFRYVNPEDAANVTEEGSDNSFLIESNTYDGKNIAPEKAAWIKMQNGCIVLTDKSSTFANAKTGGDGALIFNVENKENDTLATDNETIATSEIAVIAGEGNVTIANAAGKKVVITNILGQVVANTVIASDNAVIAAPQGVVVVAVEGEEAVKAIVK